MPHWVSHIIINSFKKFGLLFGFWISPQNPKQLNVRKRCSSFSSVSSLLSSLATNPTQLSARRRSCVVIFVLYPCYAAFFRSIPLSDPFFFGVFKIVALFWYIQYNISMPLHSSNIHWCSSPWRGSRVGYKFFERGFWYKMLKFLKSIFTILDFLIFAEGNSFPITLLNMLFMSQVS